MRHRLPSATTVITACLLGLLLGPGKADGQTAHRVKDIADGVYSSGPRGFVGSPGDSTPTYIAYKVIGDGEVGDRSRRSGRQRRQLPDRQVNGAGTSRHQIAPNRGAG